MASTKNFKKLLAPLRNSFLPLRDAALISPDGDGVVELFLEIGINLEKHLSSEEIVALRNTIESSTTFLDGGTEELVRGFPILVTSLEAAIPEKLSKVGDKLLDSLIISYIQQTNPILLTVLVLIGVIKVKESGPLDTDVKIISWIMDWKQLRTLFDNSTEIFNFYVDSNTGVKSTELLLNVRNVFWTMGFPAGFQDKDQDFIRTIVGNSRDPILRVILFSIKEENQVYEVGLSSLALLEDQSERVEGITILPFGVGSIKKDLDFGNNWKFEFRTLAEIAGGIGINLIPGQIPKLIKENRGSVGGNLDISFNLLKKTKNSDKDFLIGSPEGSGFAIGDLGFGGGIKISEKGTQGIFLEFLLEESNIIIKAKEGDSFIQRILPSEGISILVDFGIGWSTNTGFYIKGSAGLEINLPVQKTLGPITLKTVYIFLGINSKGAAELKIGATVLAKLGPLLISLERFGLEATTTISKSPDVEFGFLQPTGAGVSLNTQGITGGGFLKHDDQGYAGILQLTFKEIGLLGIGLITTGGEHGFSMLISIIGEFPKPIQLSFGFRLKAVGGLIGINRMIDLEEMQAGFKNGTVDSVLFPEDPLKNASKIMSDLRAVMPPEDGRFIVGPSVTIIWGAGNLVEAELGIFIEFPSPIRILILGELHVIAPLPQFPIIEIHLEVLGALDFAKSELGICARLYESQIQGIPIQGEAALRWNWGKNRMFGLSCGGFHPEFTPPPGFPALQRCGMQLKLGPFHLDFRFYFAVVPNAMMFGAALDMGGKIGPLRINGGFAFHALFRFDPFRFDILIEAYFSVKVKKWTLASVALRNGRLSGTRPWRIAGKIKVKVCWFKVSKSFSKTWGPREAIPIRAIDPLKLVDQALQKAESYRGVLPPTLTMVETLRSFIEDLITPNGDSPAEESSSRPLVIHPSGQLEIVQHELPLETTLELVHNSPLLNHKRIRLVPPDDFLTETLTDFFGRAEFQKLSKDERLREQFELFPNGVSLKAETVLLPEKGQESGAPEPLQAIPYAYECWKWDEGEALEPCDPPPPDQPITQPWIIGERQLESSVVTKIQEFVHHSAYLEKITRDPEIEVNPRGYHIVSVGNIQEPVGWEASARLGQSALTRTEATQLLASHLEVHPEDFGELEIVPDFELIGG